MRSRGSPKSLKTLNDPLFSFAPKDFFYEQILWHINHFIAASYTYVKVGDGRCADWDDNNWILTKDTVSETDRGSNGKTLEQCREECTTLDECRYFSWVGTYLIFLIRLFYSLLVP